MCGQSEEREMPSDLGKLGKILWKKRHLTQVLKQRQKSRLPGHYIKQAEETREKFQQNTNKE